MSEHTCKRIRPECQGCVEERAAAAARPKPVYSHREVSVTVYIQATYTKIFETTSDDDARRQHAAWMEGIDRNDLRLASSVDGDCDDSEHVEEMTREEAVSAGWKP